MSVNKIIGEYLKIYIFLSYMEWMKSLFLQNKT